MGNNVKHKTASILTLGCSKNVVDSEAILTALRQKDIDYTDNIGDADTVIINTCGFIKPAKEESIQLIMEAAEMKRQGKIKELIVAGCLSERYKHDLEVQIEDVDRFFGVNSAEQIANHLNSTSIKSELETAGKSSSAGRGGSNLLISSAVMNDGISKSHSERGLPAHSQSYASSKSGTVQNDNRISDNLKFELIGERRLLTPSHYTYIKISEGCDHPCSFCAIPLMRGKHLSRHQEEIIAEVRNLARGGIKEFILIAQDSTYYGKDLYGEKSLARLLTRLSEIDGVEWLRIMYVYPTSFPYEVLDVIAEKPNICKYIDIPFQHISDKVLKSMRRGITGRRIIELIERIRSTIDDVAIRSTFIVGYPEETEEDFSELLSFIKSAELDRVGVFTYSQEDDTHAFSLGDPIPEEVKQERMARLMKAQMKISWKKNISKIGKTFKILIDEKKNGSYIGRTQYDAPDIDNTVIIESKQKLSPGQFIEARITKASEYDLWGKGQ